MAECTHPVSARDVYGNPDPFGDRIGEVWTRIKVDAECSRCGASVPVTYSLD